MNLEQNDKQDGVNTKTKCCNCTCGCFPLLCRGGHDEEDAQHLLSPSSPPPLVADQIVYWVSYLEGMQRVLAFTPNHADAKKLRSVSMFCYGGYCECQSSVTGSTLSMY